MNGFPPIKALKGPLLVGTNNVSARLLLCYSLHFSLILFLNNMLKCWTVGPIVWHCGTLGMCWHIMHCYITITS